MYTDHLNIPEHESIYISRLINVAICRYIERDQPVPVDLEAKLSECGVIVPLM